MGYIKEPTGIDFIICGKPLTAAEYKAISDYIKADKAKRNKPFVGKNLFKRSMAAVVL